MLAFFSTPDLRGDIVGLVWCLVVMAILSRFASRPLAYQQRPPTATVTERPTPYLCLPRSAFVLCLLPRLTLLTLGR
jgi:hypothetical protein